MSGDGSWNPGDLDAHGLTVAIVASSWHAPVTDGLVAGAERACAKAGAAFATTRVPGAFEVPVVAQAAAARADAVVALAAIVRGGTPHFEYVCRAITDGLVRVSLDVRKPIGFGVLTCETLEDALDRAGLPGSREDKGSEAALSAIGTALILSAISG